jgi:hypothetical protein
MQGIVLVGGPYSIKAVAYAVPAGSAAVSWGAVEDRAPLGDGTLIELRNGTYSMPFGSWLFAPARS